MAGSRAASTNDVEVLKPTTVSGRGVKAGSVER